MRDVLLEYFNKPFITVLLLLLTRMYGMIQGRFRYYLTTVEAT